MSLAALVAGGLDLAAAATLAAAPRLLGWDRRLLAAGSATAAYARSLHAAAVVALALTGLALLLAAPPLLALGTAAAAFVAAAALALQPGPRPAARLPLLAGLVLLGLLHLWAALPLLA